MAPEAQATSPAARPPDRRRAPLVLLLAAVLAAGLSGPAGGAAAAAAPADDLFTLYELVTGEAGGRQTVLPGFFRGGATAELAVLEIGEAGGSRVRMYGLEAGAWVAVVDAALEPGVLFVDVAGSGDRDRLITYRSGRLGWLDPDAATERPLLEVAASFRATEKGVIPHVDVTRDLNHDGRDDLVVPDVDGFWISTQASDGSFAEAVKLGPPEPFADEPAGGLDVGETPGPAPRTYGELGITAETVPVYLGRVHEMDYDQDGRTDLVFWNEDHFEAHLQDERGRFDPVAETFTTEVRFDAEGVYARAFDYRDKGVMATLFGCTGKSRRTLLYAIRDVDGDGVADLVTLTLSGRSFLRQKSVYGVHFGRSTPAGTVFAAAAGTQIRPRSRAGALEPWGYASRWFGDLDGDGRIEVLFRDVAVGMVGMFRALVGNSVPIDLEIHRSEDGVYPARPAMRRRIRRFAPFAGIGNVFFPPVLIGDVDGDGRSDLVVGHSPRRLHVFRGVPGPDLLARRPVKVAVALPADERNTRLVDLNRDGKQDILIQRGPTRRAPDQPHRLTTLISPGAANPRTLRPGSTAGAGRAAPRPRRAARRR